MLTDADFGTFDRAFGRVCGAFRLKLNATEQQELTRTYFKVLEGYDIESVLRVGRELLATCKRFPTVAEWFAALETCAPAPPPPDCRQMTVSEIDTYTRADRQRFANAPCGCLECQEFGVAHESQRFVPT